VSDLFGIYKLDGVLSNEFKSLFSLPIYSMFFNTTHLHLNLGNGASDGE